MFGRLLCESFVRQRRRKLLAGLAILLGTTAVTAMLALATTIGDRIHRELAVYGANLIITPKADTLEVKVGDQVLKPATGGAVLHASDLTRLRTIFWANNITGVSPELVQDGDDALVPGQAPVPVRLVGLWFEHDLAGLHTGAPQLHPLWKLDGQWPGWKPHGDYLQVVLGSRLASKLGLRQGMSFALGDPEARAAYITPNEAVQVTGVLHSGDATEDEVIAPLAAVQGSGSDAVSRVEVAARTKPEDAFARKDPDSLSPKQHDIWYCRPYANSIAYQIREAIPGADAQQVRQIEQGESNILARISGLLWLVSAAALLAAAVAVSAAMATAVLERRAEVGLMRSLGASRGQIASLFYAEAALLALTGGLLGYAIGSVLASTLTARIFGNVTAETSLAHLFNPVLLPVILGLALLVAIAGSTASIRAALRLSPSAVLRAGA